MSLPPLTVGRKLTLSFAVLGVFLVAVIAAGFSGMGKMAGAQHHVVARAVPAQLAADAARVSASDMHFSQTAYALSGASARGDYEGDRATYGAALTKLGALSATPADQRALARVKQATAAFDRGDAKLVAAVRSGDPARVKAVVTGSQNDLSDALVAALTAYQTQVGHQEQSQVHRFSAVESSARLLMLLLAVLAAVVSSVLVWRLVRSITRAVGQVLQAAEGIAEGDLEHHVDVRSRDELGAMAAAFESMISYLHGTADAAGRIAAGDLTANVEPKSDRDVLGQAFTTMTANLRELVGSVAVSAESLSSASQQMAGTSDETGRAVGEIAAAVSDVAHGAERQVRLVESTRGAVQGAARAASASSATATTTVAAAQQASGVAREGVETADHASAAIELVATASAQVGEAIGELAERSQRIGGIVETITGIAEQTNLLALNAAIEAARAGEHGRGFAVVAEEVRKLAEESQGSAAEIAGLITQIQTETTRVVDVVADSARRTDEGVASVRRTRDAFEQIGRAVEDVTAHVQEIAAGIEEIAAEAERAESDVTEVAGVAEMSSASAEQVSASTQETSASTQQIAASAQNLADTAEQLARLVGRFTLAG
jgi:methyl-accepting chemotaxis protein